MPHYPTHTDPAVGRFIQRDPIGSGYAYANNNPISYIDPSGLGAVSWGTPWANFLNWMASPQGKTFMFVVDAALLALTVPTAGATLAIAMGLIMGTIFVAAEYILSGGKATLGNYFAAFTLGFVVGVTIASVYQSFMLAGEAALGKASLSEPALDAGATAQGGTSVDRAWQETRLAIRERPGALAIRERPGPLRVPSEKYSPEWFHEQGWVDFQVPRRGEMIGWRGSQKGVEGYTWGLGERPSSLSEIEGRFGRLWQEGTPDTLYVGRFQPGSPGYIRLNPVSGELEINIRPQFVELIDEMPLLPEV